MLRVMIAGFITICSCSFLLFAKSAVCDSQRRFVLIGTGSLTGVYYSIGGGMCRFITYGYRELRPSEKLVCSTSATAGSVYNLNSIRRGAIDIGVAQSDIGYYAYSAKNVYEGVSPMSDLRLLAYFHKEYLTVVVRKNSGINSIEDIKGKRINIGAPGTGVRSAMLDIIKIKGWTIGDFLVVSDLRSSEQVQALCDGKIDVITDFVGHPNAAMQEASATCDAVAIPLDEDLLSSITRRYSYYQIDAIKGKTYANNPGDVRTISVRASLFSTTSLPEDIAYIIAKSITDNLPAFRELSGSLRSLTTEDLVSDNGGNEYVPFHDGAVKFYKERGLLH